MNFQNHNIPNRQSGKTATTLFAIVLAFCALTLLQGFTHLFPLKLGGFTQKTEKIELSLANVPDGSYSQNLSQRAKENGGFRELYIRAYNQCQYSLFGNITNDYIIKGKEHEFYHKQYIDEYVGTNFDKIYGTVEKAYETAQENMLRLLQLRDTLEAHGSKLLVVMAPTKTDIYPEYLPDSIRNSHADFDIFEYYASLFNKNGINFTDFRSYFKSLKTKAKYPLYSRYGTHWAEATIPMVADSILRKMGEISGIDFPAVVVDDDNVMRRYAGMDRELEANMNLLFPLAKPAIPQPEYHLEEMKNGKKPNLLVIGDSYFVQLHQSAFMDAFNEVNYWKYNKEIYSTNPDYKGFVGSFQHTYKVLEGSDIVMVIFTPIHIDESFLFGICQVAEKAFEEKDSVYLSEKAIEHTILRIKSDEKWLKSVKKQAKDRGIPLERALRDNAVYTLEMEHMNSISNQEQK